jgi:hypothetical protein
MNKIYKLLTIVLLCILMANFALAKNNINSTTINITNTSSNNTIIHPVYEDKASKQFDYIMNNINPHNVFEAYFDECDSSGNINNDAHTNNPYHHIGL